MKTAGRSSLVSLRTFAPILFVAILFAVFALLPACKGKEAPLQKKASSAIVGNKAPGFTLKDVNGRSVSLADFSGKVLIIDFWATWCGPCKGATQELEKLYGRYKEKGVIIIGISMDEGNAAQKVKGFAGAHGLTYLMLLDDGQTSKSYAVRNIPATFILDKDHIIRKIYPGYLPALGTRIAEQVDSVLR